VERAAGRIRSHWALPLGLRAGEPVHSPRYEEES
jgi:hypothetical protein